MNELIRKLLIRSGEILNRNIIKEVITAHITLVCENLL